MSLLMPKQNVRPLVLSVVKAAAWKELRIALRYLPNSIGYVLQMTIRILFFLVLSNSIVLQGNQLLGGDSLFIFFLGALLIWMFSGIALQTPLASVNQDLHNGTLEYLYSNPISRYAYFLGTVVGSAIMNVIFFVPIYILLVIYAGLGIIDALSILLVCLVVILALVALGVMIALLAILFRQAHALAGVLAIMLEFVAGAYIPVNQFPIWVQSIAYALPFTWAYDLVRYYSFKGEWVPLLPIWSEWMILGCSALMYTLLSIVLLRKVEQRSKKTGFHLI